MLVHKDLVALDPEIQGFDLLILEGVRLIYARTASAPLSDA